MIIYTSGQYVTYNGQQWFIAGFEIDNEGHTVYRLARNGKRIVVDETEVE